MFHWFQRMQLGSQQQHSSKFANPNFEILYTEPSHKTQLTKPVYRRPGLKFDGEKLRNSSLYFCCVQVTVAFPDKTIPVTVSLTLATTSIVRPDNATIFVDIGHWSW